MVRVGVGRHQQVDPLHAHLPQQRHHVLRTRVDQGRLALGGLQQHGVPLTHIEEGDAQDRVGGEGKGGGGGCGGCGSATGGVVVAVRLREGGAPCAGREQERGRHGGAQGEGAAESWRARATVAAAGRRKGQLGRHGRRVGLGLEGGKVGVVWPVLDFSYDPQARDQPVPGRPRRSS